MKYLKAQDVLPAELIKELQKYASGNIIYIPKPKDSHLKWGELTGSKEYTKKRNSHVKEKHASGYDIETLAQEFCLSTDSIKKIIYA
ncbi:MAG: hypothetical protein KAQ68_09100 [Clostridiales bacterium]|nr:hypothetical protein [Clostridiales bacterium]